MAEIKDEFSKRAYCFNLWILIWCHCLCNCYVQTLPSAASLPYILYTDRQSWNTASRVCQSIGARLATVSSEVEAIFLWNVISKQMTVDDGLWIGLHISSQKNLTWSDSKCSQFNISVWNNLYDDGSHYNRKRCYILSTTYLRWDRELCSNEHKFLCEKDDNSDRCEFRDSNKQLSMVPVASPSTELCLEHCKNTTDCVMAAPYCAEHCILAVLSKNSSSQLYSKECDQGIAVLNNTKVDSVRANDRNSNTPLPCTPETITDSTDVKESIVINCSAINQPSLTADTLTSSYLEPCDPLIMTSVVTSTVYVTATMDTKTVSGDITGIVSTVTMATCIPSTVAPEDLTSWDPSTVVSTPPPVPEPTSIYITTPAIQTVYGTPSSVIPKHNFTSPLDTTMYDVFCTTYNNTNLSQETLQEILKDIVVKLKVDTKNLSTTTRKKTSAPDRRRSTTAMGYIAGVVMCIPFVLMVIADIPQLFRDLVMNRLRKQ